MPTGSVAAFLFLTFVLTGSLFGQGTTLGSIVGTVFDASGSSVPGAKVRVMNTQTGVPRETVTNEGGSFSALSLIRGSYSSQLPEAGPGEPEARSRRHNRADLPPYRRPSQRVARCPGRSRAVEN